MKIILSPSGNVRSVFSEPARKLLEAVGEVKIRRASHVDVPGDLRPAAIAALEAAGVPIVHNQWYVDLAPSGGPVLGPFPVRDDALAAELKWLEDNHCPIL